MKTALIFGTFAIGIGSLQGTYIAPSNPSKEILKCVSFDQQLPQIVTTEVADEDEVTHEVFFGENIARLKQLFE